ncbi:protein kinase [Mesorhizobium sp. SB112]|uniref:protein kinase domain-containing protein n=1 Tax=Mesorhizobium sp. SB112 TaxID=3151853 RepID=UPI0032661EF3
MNAGGSGDFDDIAKRFEALWQALQYNGTVKRETDETTMLIDRVRDALDKGLSRLNENNREFIANSFTMEERVHVSARTEIYRIRHRDLQTNHALKTLHPDHADDEIARRLLLREAHIALPLKHDNLHAPQMMLRLDDGRPALIFEWAESSLSQRLSDGSFSATEIGQAMDALLSGLTFLHSRHLIHCDLAPDNLLLSGGELASLKIADFGFALGAGQQHSDLDIGFAGHTEFLAPEQRDRAPLNMRTDLYACGLIMRLMLERCSDTDASVSRMAALATRLARENPADRPDSANSALKTLRGIVV